MHSMSILLVLGLATSTFAQTYVLQDTYSGSTFFDQFDFFTAGDPTDGWTDYVDYDTAVSNGLINSGSTPSWGVDHTSVLDPSDATGRKSIRITSKATWTHGLFIADIAHMPSSTCGLWPAFWTLGQVGTWPYSGEIDIIEGVNNGDTNLISAHTADDCTVAGSGELGTSTFETDNCAVSSSTTGCTTSDTRTNSYGTGFNSAGGGVYAMEWTSSGINIWFFPRSSIPSSISSGNPDTSSFGDPTATFAGDCDIDSHFFNHSIVFDTTFCGSWAGNVFQTDGCPMTSGQDSWPSCVTYVAETPSAFADAYWTVNSIKVYQDNNAAQVAASTSKVVPVASTSSIALTSASVALGASTTLSSTSSVEVAALSTTSTITAETSSTSSSTSSVEVPTSSIPATSAEPSPTTSAASSVEVATPSTSSTSTVGEFPFSHHHGHSGWPHNKLHRKTADAAPTPRRARRMA